MNLTRYSKASLLKARDDGRFYQFPRGRNRGSLIRCLPGQLYGRIRGVFTERKENEKEDDSGEGGAAKWREAEDKEEIGRGRATGLIIGHVRCTRRGQKLGKRCLVSTHVRPTIATSRRHAAPFFEYTREIVLEVSRDREELAYVP